MGEKKIKFTLLLATLNRPQQLRECVEGLLKQTYTNYEIIIIDQSPDENVDESIATMSPAIQYIRIQERGLSHARNVGLKYATGDYICLVDDDGVYARDVLKNAAQILAHEDIAVLCGRIVDPITQKMFCRRNDGYVSWRDVFKCCMSPSIIIQANLLREHGFDEHFGVGAKFGAGEETDIFFFALSKHQKVFFTNNYTVYHNLDGIKLDPESRRRKYYPYTYGVGAFYCKIIERYSLFWGYYHFLRAVIGNLLYGYLPFFVRDKEERNYRRGKVNCIWRGFWDYKNKEWRTAE